MDFKTNDNTNQRLWWQQSDNADVSLVRLVCGVLKLRLTPDSGADTAIVKQKVLDQLRARRMWVATRPLATPLKVEGFNSDALITEEILLSFNFEAPSEPLVLSNVKCSIVRGPFRNLLGKSF